MQSPRPPGSSPEIYPLTPLQGGMLFHTLAEPGSGAYVVQFTCLVAGGFDAEAFRASWAEALTRHPVLRTAVVWEGLEEPLQAVMPKVELPWTELDWRGMTSGAREDALESLLREDRVRGFELGRAPLMRLWLVRVADDVFRFVWSFHHILLDGWSTVVLLKEVFGSEPAETPPGAFREFVAWLRDRDPRDGKAFWQSRLAGVDGPTPLGIDRPDRSMESAGGDVASAYGHRNTHLTTGETRRLIEFAQRHRLTLNTVVRGAWALLLGRYSGRQDVLFGATVAGRPATLSGVEKRVGLFINTIPVRASVPTGSELVPWLRSLQDQQIASSEFEHVPLTHIADWSRIASAGDLFQSVLVFENSPLDGTSLTEGTTLELSEVRYLDQSTYPLALLVFPGERLEMSAVFRRPNLDAVTVDRLLEHMGAVLGSFVRDPTGNLGAHQPPFGAERDRLLREWSGASAPPRPVHQVHHANAWAAFAAIAEQVPRTPAILADGVETSYAEVYRKALALSSRLRDMGVRRDSVVALEIERSPDMLIAIMGILGAGGAYLPIGPDLPARRRRTLLEGSGALVLVSGGRQEDAREDVIPPERTVRLPLPEWSQASDREGESRGESPAGPGDLAYVIHTSGSTGAPKGVAVTHSNLLHSNGARSAVYGSPPQRFLLLSPFVFDSSIVGVFWPLLSGGTVVLPKPGMERDPAAIGKLIERTTTTHVLALPALYELILGEATQDALSSLEVVILAGESCRPEIVRAHYAKLPATRLFNEYGPTEASVWSTVHEIPPDFDGPTVPIGRPVPGALIYILDAAGQPVPIGVPGEIHISGRGVARGYVGQPDLTAQRFLPDPLGGEPNSRMYATGDIGRWTEDGIVEFLGRTDDQVKIRGHRIEVAEVEAALRDHPDVRDVVVVAHRPVIDDRTPATAESLAERMTALAPEDALRLLTEVEQLPEPSIVSESRDGTP